MLKIGKFKVCKVTGFPLWQVVVKIDGFEFESKGTVLHETAVSWEKDLNKKLKEGKK